MNLTENVSKSYDHFYRYQEITDILHEYAENYPELVRLSKGATTPEGRVQWIIEITDLSCGSFEEKPAFYVEGNIHAGEVTGCMCCMYFLDVLLTNKDEEKVRKLLQSYTVYAMPRVSPDGSEHYLTTPDYVRSVNRLYPQEEPLPGLYQKDLDGDGVVRSMRVKSPFGIWKISEKDPRIMTRREPDDTEGDFYNVYKEGLIRDYTPGQILTAPQPFGNDFNRNYPIGWLPEHRQVGAGEYPLSNPETKGNTDFLLSHPNVCMVLDMHTMGGQNLYPPGFKPRSQASSKDMELYKRLGKMMQHENTYPVVNVFDEYMPAGAQATYGGFDDFCHFILGVPAFTVECWDLDPRAKIRVQFPPKKEVSDEEQEEHALKYLQWIDNENDGEGFKDWTKFDHPQLGEVEIGGVDYKYVVQNPPIKFLLQELEKQSRVMLRLMAVLPKVSFDHIKTTPLSGEYYRVEADVMNTGFLPTYVLEEALSLRTMHLPKIKLENAEVIEGKAEFSIQHLEGFSGISGHNSGLGAFSRERDACLRHLSWVVKATKGDELTLRITADRIGRKEVQVLIE